MADHNQNSFRKKAMNRISSPEDLTGYLRVTSPGMWIVLAAVIALLVGMFAWSSVIVKDHTALIVLSGWLAKCWANRKRAAV